MENVTRVNLAAIVLITMQDRDLSSNSSSVFIFFLFSLSLFLSLTLCILYIFCSPNVTRVNLAAYCLDNNARQGSLFKLYLNVHILFVSLFLSLALCILYIFSRFLSLNLFLFVFFIFFNAINTKKIAHYTYL